MVAEQLPTPKRSFMFWDHAQNCIDYRTWGAVSEEPLFEFRAPPSTCQTIIKYIVIRNYFKVRLGNRIQLFCN